MVREICSIYDAKSNDIINHESLYAEYYLLHQQNDITVYS